MPNYTYRAKKDPEHTVAGNIQARSEKEAIEKINLLGYIPIYIVEDNTSTEGTRVSQDKSLGKIRSRQVTVFTRQLSSLLRAGVPILHAINIISEQSETVIEKEVFRGIYYAIKDGATFSSALSKYQANFSGLYIAMIRIGEDSGELPEVLSRIADYRVKQEEMYSRFKMALAYPILMAIVGISTIIFMLTFVMPRLMKIYSTMQQALPLPTRILISLSDGLRNWWFWILLAGSAFILVLRKQLRSPAGKASFSVLVLRLPLFGKFIQKAELARFSRTLELLLTSGIPILKALGISIPVLENEVISSQLRKSCKELEQGGSFGRSLKGSKIFPAFMSNLITVGEESGKLDDALAEVASAYEKDTDESIRILSSLMEPLMILVMGLIVGFIVMAMLLPIFEINVMVN